MAGNTSLLFLSGFIRYLGREGCKIHESRYNVNTYSNETLSGKITIFRHLSCEICRSTFTFGICTNGFTYPWEFESFIPNGATAKNIPFLTPSANRVLYFWIHSRSP